MCVCVCVCVCVHTKVFRIMLQQMQKTSMHTEINLFVHIHPNDWTPAFIVTVSSKGTA